MGSAATPPPDLFTASNPPFRPITKKPLVSLETRDVQPPSQVYITTDDRISVNVWNSSAGATLTYISRILKADGEIIFDQETLTLLSDRSQQTFNFNSPEGFLLSLAIAQNGSGVFRGQTWCEISIIREGPGSVNFTQTIVSDYIASKSPIGFPGGRQLNSLEGAGFVTQYALSDGALGADKAITPPTNARWLIHGVHAFYNTDATAGNRIVAFNIGLAGIEAAVFPANGTQGPSSTHVYFGADYHYLPATLGFGQMFVPFPPLPLINNNVNFALSNTGGAAGDQWTNIRVLVEEWIEPSQ